jgi:cysteinyl-tRNA synthetase, unknown class
MRKWLMSWRVQPNRFRGALLAACAALGVACDAAAQSPAPVGTDTAAALARARSWAYQLQNINVAELRRTSYDLLVVDGVSLARADVALLKKKPDGTRRLVLSYMNIGEAEDYRYYWKAAWTRSPPEWMGSENCRWRGDHRVRFWMPGWREIVLGSPRSYLGRLIAAGFDGAFLDRVDIHRRWQKEHPQATADMVAFVSGLSAWAKAQAPGFLVVPQNGEELLAFAAYRAAIDAQAKEDLLFGNHGNDVANAPARVERALDYILLAKTNGRPVFVVEYIRKPENLALAQGRLGGLGFIPYFGPRSLSRIGLGGPAHPEDRNSEPLFEEQGGAADKCR